MLYELREYEELSYFALWGYEGQVGALGIIIKLSNFWNF
jgi:hypothetical protein